MAYDPTTVANQFIELAGQDNRQLTPMQLIKLTYIAHGFSLAINHKPLIDESVEAWRYGPVIPSLYRRLKTYGNGPVSKPINQFWASEKMASEDKDLIAAVYEKYGRLSGSQLSFLTHKKGTPWEQAYSPDEYGTQLSDAAITRHYVDLLRGVAA